MPAALDSAVFADSSAAAKCVPWLAAKFSEELTSSVARSAVFPQKCLCDVSLKEMREKRCGLAACT